MENGKNGDPLNEKKIRQLVDDVAGKGKELLNEGIESAREIFHEQTDVLKKKAEEMGLDGAADNVKSYVKKHPLQSVGIAVAVGVILGRLFSPSSSED